MYTEIKTKEDLERFKDFKLCYVDQVDETIWDYTPEAKAIINSPDFSWKKEHELYGWCSSRLRQEEVPNPDREKGDYVLYFTPNFKEQWGDDWNDSPYEHNAGSPYDSTYEKEDENGNWIKYEIAYLYVKFSDDPSIWPKLPLDYGFGGNSPFSVEEINHGAIPWIFIEKLKKEDKKYCTIGGGDTLDSVIDKLKTLDIQRENKENEQLY